MPIQYINTGTGPNSGDGDSLRSAFNKINANFNQLYTSNTSNSVIIVSDVAPSAPTQGTFWYDTVSGRSYIYFDDSWIDSSPSSNANGTTSSIDLTTVTSHIIPAEDLVYDLGSIDKQWRSLYVGTGTIYIGGIPVTVNTVSNTLIVGSSTPTTSTSVATESFVIDYVNANNDLSNSTLFNGTYTVSLNTSGSLVVPGAIVGSPHSLILAADAESYNIGKYLRIRSGDLEPSHIHLDAPFGTNYDVILGGDTTFVKVDTTGTVIIGTSGNELHNWKFNSDGSLTLPNGHPVYFGPGNASIQSALGFHIKSDEGIAIDARDITDVENPITRQWYFSPNGNLTFPDQTVQTTAYTGGETVIELDGVTTAFTITNVKTLLTVGVASGYFGSDAFTITLPQGIPGQRLVLLNSSSLCTGTVDGNKTLLPSLTLELMYSEYDGSWFQI